MKNENETKVNILKGVNQRLRIRDIKIAIISITICLLLGVITYFILFVKQEPMNVEEFSQVTIKTKLETINQVDSRELTYNYLAFTTQQSLFFTNKSFYIENKDDNTSTLYFYISRNIMQKSKKEELSNEKMNVEILLYPSLCNTDKINEITKVCYLFYDYKDLKQKEFNKVKDKAVVLWEK